MEKDPQKSCKSCLDEEEIQQILWRYKCHLNEVSYQYTLLQYNVQVAKVDVCLPAAVRKEFTKLTSPDDLTVLGRCPSGFLQAPGRRQKMKKKKKKNGKSWMDN